MPGVPRTAISLYGECDVDWIAESPTLTGRTRYDQTNTQQVEDWTRFDLGTRYGFVGPCGKPVEIRADVENVLDARYRALSARRPPFGLVRIPETLRRPGGTENRSLRGSGALEAGGTPGGSLRRPRWAPTCPRGSKRSRT